MAKNIMWVGLNEVQPNTLQDSKDGADGRFVGFRYALPNLRVVKKNLELLGFVVL